MNRKIIILTFGVMAFGTMTFFIGLIAGQARGLSEGIGLAEKTHTENTGDLNKALVVIQDYYSEHLKYPTSLELFGAITTVQEVTEHQVRLYSGVGSSHFYTITYLDKGRVSVARE